MSAKQTPENFWARVDRRRPTACWEWTGAKTSAGYGNLMWHGAHVQAHRVAYWLTHGGISLVTGFRRTGVAAKYKRFVLHRCDNKACCNPGHLFLGSMRANLLDAYAKGRKAQPQGADHANSKLSKAQAKAARKAYDSGSTQAQLAAKYGVSQRAISLLVRGETYRG